MGEPTEQDYRDAALAGGAHTSPRPGTLAPGVYPDAVRGHALIADGRRSVVLLDLGGVVTLAGIEIDAAGLEQLGQHLLYVAARKAAATTGAAA